MPLFTNTINHFWQFPTKLRDLEDSRETSFWKLSVVYLTWFEWNLLMYQNRSHNMNPPLSPSNGNRSHNLPCLTRLRHGLIRGLAKDTGCRLNFTVGGLSLSLATHCLSSTTLEGLHDVVRTYTHMILPHHLVSFLYGAVLRNTMKPAVTFDLLYSKIEISTECVFLYSCHSVVI